MSDLDLGKIFVLSWIMTLVIIVMGMVWISGERSLHTRTCKEITETYEDYNKCIKE